MNETRRNFIALSSLLPFFNKDLNAFLQETKQDSTLSKMQDGNIVFSKNKIFPPALKPGSKIAITAPASPTSMGEIMRGKKAFEKLGCKVEIGDTIKNSSWKTRYLSASDEIRAEELTNYFNREDINCILSGRGGFGSIRILSLLDYSLIQNNPKIIMGYSDITAIINAINVKTNIITFHGPVASSNFDSQTLDNINKIFFAIKEFIPIKYHLQKIDILVKGIATGELVGGNLSVITSLLGTPFEIQTHGKILFLEEVSEHPYKIDRMLTQLLLADKLQNCSGIIFGHFQGLDAKRNFFPGYSFTIRQIIESKIKPLGIPSILGFPIGHNDERQIILPIGTLAEFNTVDKTFTLLEKSVYIHEK